MCFLPPNTTAALQPVDQGIGKSLKVQYRKMVINRLITLMDSNAVENAVSLAKAINMLDCCQWLFLAWNNVSTDCIIKCFRKAGIGESICSQEIIVAPEFPITIMNGMTTEEYISFDENLPICDEIVDFENYIMQRITKDCNEETIDSSTESEEEEL
ncbi:tigger transposable element-derived protein 6-like protein, partial [Leptotrombidium deliense]